ncbi:hypothetical protein LEP1GSC150_2116 [Leptospira interrogans serovar Copenhageni str. LT2050]|uniref:Uncharacterized protein n=1 Tax=Leptospira interrogans serovar Copenhageni str. LT2050 TaxID=1001598 RepID=M3IFB9_LEPIT|nr:hypothetical protein LEP1GSC150_2116 [Leptospira interrogans serovar Copenhageni str. LT2050]
MKQEPVSYLFRFFVIHFRDKILSRVFNSENPLKQLVKLCSVLLFLNGFLFVFSIKDLWRVPESNQYEKPSVLYGLGEKTNTNQSQNFIVFQGSF